MCKKVTLNFWIGKNNEMMVSITAMRAGIFFVTKVGYFAPGPQTSVLGTWHTSCFGEAVVESLRLCENQQTSEQLYILCRLCSGNVSHILACHCWNRTELIKGSNCYRIADHALAAVLLSLLRIPNLLVGYLPVSEEERLVIWHSHTLVPFDSFNC